MSKFMDMLGTEEELSPELAAYLTEDGMFGPSIRHPLVYSVMHNPAINAFVNAQLRQKQEALQRAEGERQWSTYVWLHERPWRLDAFLEISDRLDDEQYWNLAGSIWVDSENIHQNLDTWRDIFDNPERGSQEFFMDEEDRKIVKLSENKGGLPFTFTLYRGFSESGGEDGFSWTLDRDRACWFARRFCHGDDMEPMLATGIAGRKDVIGYMSGRGEREIVCLPENVHQIEIEFLT